MEGRTRLVRGSASTKQIQPLKQCFALQAGKLRLDSDSLSVVGLAPEACHALVDANRPCMYLGISILKTKGKLELE
jgi:hypothetical protein